MVTPRNARPRRIEILTYPEGQTLDVVGPLEVFATANRFIDAPGARPDRAMVRGRAYALEVVAPDAGPVRMSSGLALVADRSLAESKASRQALDTLIVAGGNGTERVYGDAQVRAFIRARAAKARRVVSVCTGTFLLAGAGLLDGRRVTTHWGACERLARLHPEVQVEPDPIFVVDGSIYTSAGVTAGMDLALALVEEDHGRDLALEVARTLVLFLKRPGGQSQFSAQLANRLPARQALREIQRFIAENPADDHSVERLAQRSAMSPRNFARVFADEVGTTPARFVERSRVEAARRHLEDSSEGIEGIARICGFGSAETMRRAFLRHLRAGPAEYRSRFRSSRAASKPERMEAGR